MITQILDWLVQTEWGLPNWGGVAVVGTFAWGMVRLARPRPDEAVIRPMTKEEL